MLLPDFERILDVSSRVFMPVRNDGISSAKAAQLLSHIKAMGDIGMEEKIMRLEPPYFKDIPLITSDLRGSEVGKYVLGLMERNHG